MSVTTEFKKVSETALAQGKATLTLTLTEARKPFFAYVGVTDLAVEKLREVRSEVKTRGLLSSVEDYTIKATEKTVDVYEDLTERGENLVRAIRRQPATKAAVRQGRRTKSAAKATKTAARRSAANTRRSTKATATSARETATATAKAADQGASKVG